MTYIVVKSTYDDLVERNVHIVTILRVVIVTQVDRGIVKVPAHVGAAQFGGGGRFSRIFSGFGAFTGGGGRCGIRFRRESPFTGSRHFLNKEIILINRNIILGSIETDRISNWPDTGLRYPVGWILYLDRILEKMQGRISVASLLVARIHINFHFPSSS